MFKLILFKIFWYLCSFFNPKLVRSLLYAGLKDKSFPYATFFDGALKNTIFGKNFKTPIGIASGFDRTGFFIDELIRIGYGFGELGSYTLTEETPEVKTEFIQNKKAILYQSLGYDNKGIEKSVSVFRNRRYLPHIVGINITTTGQNEESNVKNGVPLTYDKEFALMASKIAPYCDYVVLNLAHNQTELYRLVSDKYSVIRIVKAVKEAISKSATANPPALLLKFPLSLTELEIKTICEFLPEIAIDGVILGGACPVNQKIITALNIKHQGLTDGMISGKPLNDLAITVLKQFYQYSKGKVPIISCGGIFTAQDVFERISWGASLVQMHSALFYETPDTIQKINRELAKIIKSKGFKNIQEAIGCAYL